MKGIGTLIATATSHAGRVGLVVCILLWRPEAVSGQIVGSNPWFVRAGIAPGYILPDNPFLLTVNGAGDPARLAPNLTLEIGRQTDGSQDWHALYGMPSYGFGVSLVSFRNGFETGRPVEAYTFFSWPFARLSQRLTVTTEFGMGVSWGWNQNGKTGDSENVLGSDVNARINWGFNLRYDVTRRVALYTGIDYTHRSNGGLVQRAASAGTTSM